MLTQAELQHHLAKMPGAIEVRVDIYRFRFIATVVSPLFRGVNEGERQARVADYLYPLVGDDGWRQIEFIFVNTPEEQAAEDADDAAALT